MFVNLVKKGLRDRIFVSVTFKIKHEKWLKTLKLEQVSRMSAKMTRIVH